MDNFYILIKNQYLTTEHKPQTITPWLGDTVGWWDGDTFVMETVNVKPIQAENQAFPLSSSGVVTERLTRTSDHDIFYEFTVNDPEIYTQPWKAELSFYPSKGMFEYACHEGNYGMHGILAGAREEERQAEQGDPLDAHRGAAYPIDSPSVCQFGAAHPRRADRLPHGPVRSRPRAA